ncbi:glycosyltransferase [Segetibacter aerophilus]|uniref:Streptomycin biosynthesis protein StrF domain-containing protein n=1 Tax=Segetibacter aerophilus TaxID=670293 RepID=A0A512B6N2_9BACT|nr:glycosyltransferase [Segetibacter aerophilus]GEO07616.1 hypothetical protein SAE01_01120 [Segetibacter aerophilus]
MISIIICSINHEFLKQLKLNIEKTVGLAFEIIAIDNNIEKKSISAVYNQGAKAANFDYLCFLHEDVTIHSKYWGQRLMELLTDETVGLIGVSGTVYKSKYAATWSACDQSLYRTHSIQHFTDRLTPKVTCINPGQASTAEVVVVDGVFMATRKDVFTQFKFDDNNFKRFHGYDLDYSLQVGTKYKVVVTFEILLEHLSPGQLNRQWLDASLILHKKWKKSLPASIGNISKKAVSVSDSLACSLVLMMMIKYNCSKLGVANNYFKLITTFFRYNRLKHSKTVIKYLLST